jgi:hypothetical protein
MTTIARQRPIQTAVTFAPAVIGLEGDYLLCDGERFAPRRVMGAGALSNFMELADASADKILGFAKRWGALYIDKKPVPGRPKFLEPLSTWRHFATRVRAMYQIGLEVNLRRRGREEDWASLDIQPGDARSSIGEARLQLMSQVRRFVAVGRLQPRLFWDITSDQWQIDFDSDLRSNLLALFTVRLMIEIADKDGLAICSNCKLPYQPAKRPSVGRRNYCPQCRRAGAPDRDSKREERRRKKEQDAN